MLAIKVSCVFAQKKYIPQFDIKIELIENTFVSRKV